jgi:hypothetical protein
MELLSLSLFCCCDYAVPMSRSRQVGSGGLMSCPAPLGRQNYCFQEDWQLDWGWDGLNI